MLSSRGGKDAGPGFASKAPHQSPPPVSLLSTWISEVFATAGTREGLFYSAGLEGLSCSGRFWGLVQGAASINMDEESVSKIK